MGVNGMLTAGEGSVTMAAPARLMDYHLGTPVHFHFKRGYWRKWKSGTGARKFIL